MTSILLWFSVKKAGGSSSEKNLHFKKEEEEVMAFLVAPVRPRRNDRRSVPCPLPAGGTGPNEKHILEMTEA